jgi:DNA-binding PadR family transcriptional regulator
MTFPVPDETILGILAFAPQHGYQIIQYFKDEKALGRIWTMSNSQIYAVLKRLENQKSITGNKIPSLEGPPKKEYAITPIGKKQLNEWLYAPKPSSSIRRIRVEFLSKLYVAKLLNLSIPEIITPQIQTCHHQREILSKEQTKFVSEMEMGAMTLSFILGQLDAALDWLKKLNENFT